MDGNGPFEIRCMTNGDSLAAVDKMWDRPALYGVYRANVCWAVALEHGERFARLIAAAADLSYAMNAADTES